MNSNYGIKRGATHVSNRVRFYIFSAPLGRSVLTLLLIRYLRNSASSEVQACYRASGTEIGFKRNVETSHNRDAVGILSV